MEFITGQKGEIEEIWNVQHVTQLNYIPGRDQHHFFSTPMSTLYIVTLIACIVVNDVYSNLDHMI